MRYKGVTKFMAGLLAAAMVVTGIPAATLDTAEAKSKTEKLSYKGYTKVWEDNFDGNSLNMKDWNVETHEPGWVNAELQEYTESGNIKVSDGKLTIIPKRTKNADGTYSYTSGRINTQNKHDFKYGIMEARMKFPKGQGYLPAFWMMPTNENLYGQWPKCGEIDIAEVMGQDTKKIYGTIHYGEPHAQSQGTEVLKKGNFADDWHTCAVEWEPGSIKWYVDGVLYHEEHSWFTKTPGQGEVTYPAPFDQNFYIIFNLAIGGSWVGYPDKTTDYNSNFQVDYVKVYQKKNYNDNVKKPEKKVVLKKADKKGNFISNADFSKNEKLDGSANWQFMTAQSGEGSAAIKNKKIEIKTKNAGKEEYSIQLVQPGLPMEKGATYEVSFDAYADKARTMKVDISGPDMNYMRYFNDTAVNLTTKKKSYKFKFTMNEDTDANSRLEFNMGAQGSTANVYITNVKVKKIKSASKAEVNKKTVLADGNLVYNGKFQEGDKRLGYWNIKKKNASVAVSNKDYNDRKLVVKLTKDSKAADVKVYQTGLAFEANKEYSVSFDASATTARTIKVKVAGQTFNAKLNKATKNYEFIMKTGKKLTDKNVIFYLGGKKGTVCIDNVVVTENSLIKNGSFNAGTTGWTEWHDTSEADLSFVIDSLSEDNAADFTIKKTGSEDWKIQLKQENVPLEKDQYYKLTFKAKSSKTRKMRAIMQGLEDKGWAVYSGENTVKLTSKYKTYTKVFQMTADSDPKSQISFCLGAVAGKAINTQHRVCIDDVNLEIISEKEAKKYLGEGPKTQDSMIKDGTFVKGMELWSEWHEAAEADAQYEVVDNAVHFTVNKTGSEDWKIQLKQENIKLEQGHYYKLTFKGKSDLERKVRATVQGGESRNYSHYTGDYFVTLKKDYQTYEHVFKMNEATDDKTSFQICMGAVGGAINKTHNMYFTDFSLVEISEEEGKKLAKNQFAGGVAGGGYSGYTPPSAPPVINKLEKLSDTDMQDAAKGYSATAGVGNVTVSKVPSTGESQIVMETAGTDATHLKIPIVKATGVTAGQYQKITTTVRYSDASVSSFRRVRSAGEPETYKVKFAWHLSDGSEIILKDAEGNEDVTVTKADKGVAVELFSNPLSSTQLDGATLLCYAGTMGSGKHLLIGEVKSQEYKYTNLLGSFTKNWSNGWGAGYNTADIPNEGLQEPKPSGDGVEFNFSNASDQDWKIQITKKPLSFTKGAKYAYSYTVKTSEPWGLKTSVQKSDYSELTQGVTEEVKTEANKSIVVRKEFIASVTTETAIFGINLGAGVQGNPSGDLGKTVKVQINNLQLVKLADPTQEENQEQSDTVIIGSELLSDTEVSDAVFKGATGLVKDKTNGEVEIQIKNAGDQKGSIEIAKEGIRLDVGAKYKWSFEIKTTAQWGVSASMLELQKPWNGYGAVWDQAITPGAFYTIESEEFTCGYENAKFYMLIGKYDFNAGETTTLNIKNLKLLQTQPAPAGGNTETNLFKNPEFAATGNGLWETWNSFGCGSLERIEKKQIITNEYGFGYPDNGKTIYVYHADLAQIGSGKTDVMLQQSGITLEPGTYKVSFEILSTAVRPIQFHLGDACSEVYDINQASVIDDESHWITCEKADITFAEGLNNGVFEIYLGKFSEDSELSAHSIRIRNIRLVKVS